MYIVGYSWVLLHMAKTLNEQGQLDLEGQQASYFGYS